MSANLGMRKARFQDTQARIKAIRLALGKAEGRTTKKGKPKAITQEEFAHRIGAGVSAVKKWEAHGDDHQEPERDSLIELNKVAPVELRFTLSDTEVPAPPPPQSSNLSQLHAQALRWFPRKPDGQPFTEDEWREFVTSAAATLDKP